jgi:hypothetical protein
MVSDLKQALAQLQLKIALGKDGAAKGATHNAASR